MSRPLHRTKTAPVNHGGRLEQYPAAGPHPSVIGMKKLYWGLDAYCVRCGAFVFKVPFHVWERY